MASIRDALANIPVAINPYYGDPTLQWQDTIGKLRELENTGHRGPVGIITKGAISPQRAKELASLQLPGLLVMVSVSELSKEIEGVGHEHRYKAIRTLREEGVRVFAAVRPLTPPHNTGAEVLERIFSRLQQAGCQTACVSGFRGDDTLVQAMAPDSAINWVLRVKQMTGFNLVMEAAHAHGVQLFTRVACAVSHLTKKSGTYNAYWGSPQLVRCAEIQCPMRATCGPVSPDRDAMSWLRQVGYQVEEESAAQAKCGYTADNRLNCRSCCTTCYVQRQPRVVVHNARTLGDLTFCRFLLGGTLCIHPGMVDGGAKDVAHVTLVQEQTGLSVHCINTWFVMARQMEKCFGCSYCVSKLYPNSGPVGVPPVRLLDFFPEEYR